MNFVYLTPLRVRNVVYLTPLRFVYSPTGLSYIYFLTARSAFLHEVFYSLEGAFYGTGS